MKFDDFKNSAIGLLVEGLGSLIMHAEKPSG
jgi:hypothetical protein